MIIPDRVDAIAQIAGVNERPLIESLQSSINPQVLAVERAAIQASEVLNISLAADVLEKEIFPNQTGNLSSIMVFTGGFKAPSGSQKIGAMGKDKLIGLFPPDIHGHDGELWAVDLGRNDVSLIVAGRPHPGEFSDQPYGNMCFAHNSRVYQELARRNRARGGETNIILTFLTGVDEISRLSTGKVAVVVDEAELANDVHPGLGPHGILDKYCGFRFQAKAGRAASPGLTQKYLSLARQAGLDIQPAISVGTPGRPEFEGVFEAGLVRAGYREAQQMDLLKEIVKPVFGDIGLIQMTLFYGMGISAELAVYRQLKPNEAEARVLPLILATDTVGDKESLTIDHFKVVTEANAKAEPHRDILMRLAADLAGQTQPNAHDFSIRAQLTAEGVYK